ncbi:MAG TPA: DUF2304 domain-containing protein [Planctomycetota bacterium]|nr:DUF2304 domain-containing protein [Planctomycetota bacterium]
MPLVMRVVIFVAAFVLMFIIFELVRKRRLREEYSWLWLLTGLLILALALIPEEVLVYVAKTVMGTPNPPSAIFFLAFCFMVLVCLQFSVRLSRMTEQVKTLAQKIALLEQDIEQERELLAKKG